MPFGNARANVPKWRNGRRRGFKIPRLNGLVGSSPTLGTRHIPFLDALEASEAVVRTDPHKINQIDMVVTDHLAFATFIPDSPRFGFLRSVKGRLAARLRPNLRQQVCQLSALVNSRNSAVGDELAVE